MLHLLYFILLFFIFKLFLNICLLYFSDNYFPPAFLKTFFSKINYAPFFVAAVVNVDGLYVNVCIL